MKPQLGSDGKHRHTGDHEQLWLLISEACSSLVGPFPPQIQIRVIHLTGGMRAGGGRRGETGGGDASGGLA